MEITNKAKQTLIGAKVTKIEDGLIHFDNGQTIVLTDEEATVLNNQANK